MLKLTGALVALSTVLSTGLAGLAVPPVLAQAGTGETAIDFTAQDGDSVAAWRGTLSVPEDWSDPDSRTIELSYVRFPATGETAGPPIVYLAGGPGGSGSGTARGPRFALFQAMRAHGDVIAFDQRGTGDSTALPRCESGVSVSPAERHTDAELAAAWRRAVEACGEDWRSQGIAIEGYTTLDSVRDLNALRDHLGADRMTLWGISYGSHLALAAVDEIPDEIDRVIIASAEGLDQTVKLPSRTDAYFARLQAAIDTQAAAAAAYPDVAGLMGRVHARLEAEPLALDVPDGEGGTTRVLLQRRHMQDFASGLISDPQYAAILLALYASLDAGETGLLIGLMQQFGTPDGDIGLNAMSTAMDLASGISPQRLARYEAEARDGLVGGYLNFPMPQIAGAWEGFDLGREFREGPTGDVPVLLLTGTLDGRTYPEGQAEAVAGLSNVTQVIVRHAGHNLFMTSDEVHDAMHRFMRGEPVGPGEIVVDLPDFTQLPF